MAFHLEILVPDRAFFSEKVQELVVKTPGGEIGILEGHIPMVVAVSIGPVKIKKDDKWISAFVSEGFMEVTSEKTVLLADSAEWPEEIDLERAKAAEKRAREHLADQTDDLEQRAALQRALGRQRVSKEIK